MEHGTGTNKPARERFMTIQILASLNLLETLAFRFISSWKYKRKTYKMMTYMCKIKAWFGIERQHDLFVLLANALISTSFKY